MFPTLGRRKLASITVDDVAALIGELQRKRHVRGKDENGKRSRSRMPRGRYVASWPCSGGCSAPPRGLVTFLAETKTEAAKRSIPLPPGLVKMLAAHRLASPHSGETNFVFASSGGRPLAVRNITRRGLDKASATAGLPRLRWHELRHVAASALIADGASVGYVSRLLGHSSPAITLSTCAHAFAAAEHDERTRERMEAAFSDVLAASGDGKVLESSDGKPGRTGGHPGTAEPAPLREIGSHGN